MSLPIYSGLVNSPLWYLSSIIDTFEWDYDDKSGIFYFGSKNQIYFIKVFESIDKFKLSKRIYEAKIQYYMKAHHEYIVGLCTIPNGILISFKGEKLLPRFASCGKDKMIRIWSFNEDTGCCCLKEFNLSSTKIISNPTCLSVNSSNVIMCGFEKGHLLSWNYNIETESKTFSTINEDIVQIAWKENKFAVAYKKGFVIINLYKSYDSISQLTKIRAHSSDVCNVCWNPNVDNIESWGDLATSGKDRKIKLWKTEKNFNLNTLTIPSTFKRMNIEAPSDKDSSSATSSNWSSLCWSSVNKGSLIVSTGFGNIGIWKTPSSTELKYFTQNNFTKAHAKSVFSVTEFINNKGLILSHSLDRVLNISRIDDTYKDGEYVYSMSCLGGSVLSLDTVNHSNQLAIGCSDNLIRLWRFDNTTKKSQEVTNIWNGINGKILSICWHPLREGLLAFGTESGEVGCVKVAKDKKIATPSRLFHSGKVFVISWGVDIRKDYSEQSFEEMQDNLIIYSVGSYSLFLHDFRQNDYMDVSHLVYDGNLRISDFIFHDSLNYFAVGYSNGMVSIFAVKKNNSSLLKVCQIKTHTKGINCMRWCPTKTDYGAALYRLAIGSNERFMTVTDLGKVINDFESSDRHNWVVVDFDEHLATFQGHGDRITSIDWCPFDGDKLVSGSYDHTAFVWSIKTKSSLSCFTSHQGKVTCCKWSNRDEDLIFSGGEDCNLFAWRPSQQPVKSEFNKRRNVAPSIPGFSGNKPIADVPLVVNVPNEIASDTKAKTEPEPESKLVNSKRYHEKRSSLFPTTMFFVHHSLPAYQNSVLSFIEQRGDYLPCMALFDSRAAIIDQIDKELIHHREKGNLDNYFTLLIWMSKLGRVVQECMLMNYVPHWLCLLISLYSARGFNEDLIRSMVNAAVNDHKDPILAATYWLAMSQSKRAIEVLVKNECIREALILAKLRLAPDDAVIGDLLPLLRDKLFKNGNFELSAVCSVTMADYRDAVQSMNRRCSKLASWVTIKIAVKYDQAELAHECAFNFVNAILLEMCDSEGTLGGTDNKQWIDKIQSTNQISAYSILIDVHMYLWIGLKSLKEISILLKNKLDRCDEKELSRLCDKIQSKLITKQINQSQDQISVYLTYEIMLMILAHINDDNHNGFHGDGDASSDGVMFGQLNDLINQFHRINSSGQKLIEQLIGGTQEDQVDGKEMIKMMTENLLNLKLHDE